MAEAVVIAFSQVCTYIYTYILHTLKYEMYFCMIYLLYLRMTYVCVCASTVCA